MVKWVKWRVFRNCMIHVIRQWNVDLSDVSASVVARRWGKASDYRNLSCFLADRTHRQTDWQTDNKQFMMQHAKPFRILCMYMHRVARFLAPSVDISFILVVYVMATVTATERLIKNAQLLTTATWMHNCTARKTVSERKASISQF